MDKRYGERIVEITIDDFSEYIQTTSKIMPKPYIKGKCNIPKKYQNDDYYFDKKSKFDFKTKSNIQIEVLMSKITGKMVPSNSKTVSRPRIKKVNGQDVYNQNAMQFSRAKIVNILHDYFKSKINISPIEVNENPMHLEMLFYVHDMGKNNVDNDNKWIWRKCLQDTLVELGIIPDDNVKIISRNSEETILIPESDSQQLIIRLWR